MRPSKALRRRETDLSRSLFSHTSDEHMDVSVVIVMEKKGKIPQRGTAKRNILQLNNIQDFVVWKRISWISLFNNDDATQWAQATHKLQFCGSQAQDSLRFDATIPDLTTASRLVHIFHAICVQLDFDGFSEQLYSTSCTRHPISTMHYLVHAHTHAINHLQEWEAATSSMLSVDVFCWVFFTLLLCCVCKRGVRGTWSLRWRKWTLILSCFLSLINIVSIILLSQRKLFWQYYHCCPSHIHFAVPLLACLFRSC